MANKVGTKTGQKTSAGKEVYKTPEGESVSEKSVTIKFGDNAYVNAPSIHNGKRYTEDEIKEMLLEGTIKPTSRHDTLEEAIKAAKTRSDNLLKDGGMAKRMAKQMELFEPVERGFEEGGLMDEGGMVDEMSGNEVPPGSLREEVRDDIPAQLSEGEFVFPADVVRYFGLEKLMEMRQEAKAGLARMEAMGQMGNSDEATLPDDIPFDVEDLEVDNEEDDLEFQVGGYVPGMYQRPMMQPQPYSPYGQQPPSVFGPQPSSVQPSFTYTPDRSNLPTFQQTIGPGVPYVDFEYVEYVNDAGQTVRLRRSKTTGKLLDPVPVGFRPKDQQVKTQTTRVTGPRQDYGGGDGGRSVESATVTGTVTGYTSPSSTMSEVGGFLTKDIEANANAFGGHRVFGIENKAMRNAILDQAKYQLGSISPMGAIGSALAKEFGFTQANFNDMAVAGQQAKEAALTTLGFTRSSQLQTSDQATMYGNMISAAHAAAKKGENVSVALAREMNNPAYAEAIKGAAVSALQGLGYTSDKITDSVTVSRAVAGYRAAADAYREDAAQTQSSGVVKTSSGIVKSGLTGKPVMSEIARNKMNAELEAAATAEAKANAIAAEQARQRGNVSRTQDEGGVTGTPTDTDVANAKAAAAAAGYNDYGGYEDDNTDGGATGVGSSGSGGYGGTGSGVGTDDGGGGYGDGDSDSGGGRDGGDDNGGGGGGGGGGSGGSSCFAAGTKFFMEDGSLKNIEDIKIGDVLQRGGKVRTTIVGDGLYENWYLYGNTKVTGTHTVFENGTWKRVENSDKAIPTDKDEFIYTLVNEKHRLIAEDGVMYGDYDEVDNLDIEDGLLEMMNLQDAVEEAA